MATRAYALIVLHSAPLIKECKGKGFPTDEQLPQRNHIEHSKHLYNQFLTCVNPATSQSTIIGKTADGYYVGVKANPNSELKTDSLDTTKIRLLNVKRNIKTGKIQEATIFVTPETQEHLENKITSYGKLRENGKPHNQDLMSRIDDFIPRDIKDLWFDDKKAYPKDKAYWCEFWIDCAHCEPDANRLEIKNRFSTMCKAMNIRYSAGSLDYPQSIVKAALVNEKDMLNLTRHLQGKVSCIRRCIQPASFYTNQNMDNADKAISTILDNIEVANDKNISVCILDTGLYSEHRLIKPFLTETYQPLEVGNLEAFDKNGHGTNMAGTVLYNDLRLFLDSSLRLRIGYKIEAVKVLETADSIEVSSEDIERKYPLFGEIFKQAVAKIELQNPSAKRIFCSAVTSDEENLTGNNDSWSAAIDALTSGFEEEFNPKRLFIESIGNSDPKQRKAFANYPNDSYFMQAQSPSQSWNAISVGAFTSFTFPYEDNPDSKPIAEEGGLSPYSSITKGWKKTAPIKPDVVFEGGNAVCRYDGQYDRNTDLELLTTSKSSIKPFDAFNGTSAATAQAAGFAAHISYLYPNLWPETVRGLMIHSAEWTESMRKTYLGTSNKKPNKSQILSLLRSCGYGVPNFEKAIHCFENFVNIVVEGKIKPLRFDKKKGKSIPMSLALYELPWPEELLVSLGNTPVKIKFTLSYFIEPNLNEKGNEPKNRYQSIGLVFEINNPGETKSEFISRISNILDTSASTSLGDKRPWTIGPSIRNNGSIHSDFIEASAIDFADIKYVAVRPNHGWWDILDECPDVRYSLIVSLETPEINESIYSAIQTKIAATISQSIAIGTPEI